MAVAHRAIGGPSAHRTTFSSNRHWNEGTSNLKTISWPLRSMCSFAFEALHPTYARSFVGFARQCRR